MYRGRLWTMRQYAGFATAEETNQRFRYLLEQGQTGLSVAFDLPTQMGYDSDAPAAEGEVGRVGVPICSARRHGGPARRAAARRGHDLDDDQRHGPDPARPLRRGGRGAGRRRASSIGGTIQNDILKEYIARGTYIYPPRPSMRLVTDVFEFCAAELPRWNTISISGYHMREAGATAAQELAFTLADAIAYVEAAVARGLDVDDFAGRLSFFFAAWSELFEEVAKFRAARRMWATIMRERFGATDPRSMMCRFHVQTAGSQPDRPVDRQQRRPDHDPGARRGPRRRPEPAHQLPRRGARPADRGGRPAGPADPADPRLRGRRDRDARPAGRLLLRREPDRRARGGRVGLPRRDRGPRRHARGHRARASSSARSRRRPTASSGRSKRATRSSSASTVPRRRRSTRRRPTRIDPDGERRQVERVRRVRAERSAEAWAAAHGRARARSPARTAT